MRRSPFPVPRIDPGADGGPGLVRAAAGNRARDGLVIRAPNHLGDLVLALPALEQSGPDAIVVRRPLLPLLQMAALPARLIPLDRGVRSLFSTAATLRTGRYRRGVLLAPSLSSALLFRLGGVAERRGTATDGRSFLLSESVDPRQFATVHRAASYVALAEGTHPAVPPVPSIAVDPAAGARWRNLAGESGRSIGIFPGSNASSRRWPAERFADVTRELTGQGHRVIVFGGPSEVGLTGTAAAGAGLDLGGKTDLPTLAAGLADCALLLTNDSGPMHLAGAVGTPTISLWGAGNPAETGPLGAGHLVLRHAELPCVPCRMNQCPRSGSGTILPEARRECLALITVAEVLAAVSRALTR